MLPQTLRPSAAVTLLMWQIFALIISLLVILGAAKRRSNKNFQSIVFESDRALLTLAATTGLEQALTDDTASEGYYAISMDISLNITGLEVGEGPIDCWVMQNDWTLAEFEAYLELATGFDRGNMQSREVQARGRTMKHIGMIGAIEPNLNDGKPKRVKLGIYIAEGHTLDLVYYNSSIALLTTGAVVHASGKMYGRWT